MRIREITGGFKTRPTFGRRGVPEASPEKPLPPHHLRAEVADAARYPTPEQYASEKTWHIQPTNTDPPQFHMRYRDEHNQYIRRWKRFRDFGWL
jgi:hypothetical protein